MKAYIDFDTLALWVHLASTALSLGGMAFFVFFYLPLASKLPNEEEFLDRKVETVRLFININGYLMLFMFMSGVVNLLKYKAAYGLDYFRQVGPVLGIKLGFVFLYVMLMSMAMFALGMKYIRIAKGLVPAADRDAALLLYQHKLKRLHWILIVLIGIIIYWGIVLVKENGRMFPGV
ncbi:MAG: hypothetical protein KIT79_04760 [Deltaproteobacteria bacterium]|nr:hypothetical protein [Deltaproteobacteria bacterium]